MKLVGDEFKEVLSEKSKSNDSKLILALDVPKNIEDEKLEQKCLEILEKASNSIAGVKIGYPLVLKTGLEIIAEANETSNVLIIADFKIADIPHISKEIARYAYESGAEAVIAHGFTGQDSLEAINEISKEMGNKGVIVVSNMSHPGGEKFIRPVSDEILNLAKEVGATGIIGPATRPEDVSNLRSKAGNEILILTPGIGAQGAKAGDAIKSGADYEIVGRAIYNSESPEESAERIRKEINQNISED